MKKTRQRLEPIESSLPSVPKGYLWRRSRGKHLPLSGDNHGVVYWTFSTFGGPARGGVREVLCMETDDAEEAAREVRHLCRMIAWPPKGCSSGSPASKAFRHSITGAAAWHYRNKLLRSLSRIGRKAEVELRRRLKEGERW